MYAESWAMGLFGFGLGQPQYFTSN
jgi:hypothetical protein